MASPQRFPYRELDLQLPQFRLLHLIPAGEYSGDIQCRHTESIIFESNSYHALSYTWGDPNDTLPISIDGHTFNVTKNLETALRQLRLLDTERTLWVDAVCIN
jgi:hypothetical protein